MEAKLARQQLSKRDLPPIEKPRRNKKGTRSDPGALVSNVHFLLKIFENYTGYDFVSRKRSEAGSENLKSFMLGAKRYFLIIVLEYGIFKFDVDSGLHRQ